MIGRDEHPHYGAGLEARLPETEGIVVPLVTVVSTKVPEHEPIDVRVGGEGEIYTVTFGGRVTMFVPVEHMAPFATAVHAADASAVITTRPE